MFICRASFAEGKSKKVWISVKRILIVKLLEETLRKNLSEMELSLKSFEIAYRLTLEKLAPLKQKYIRHSNGSFMNRTLRKAIMTRSKLKRRCNLGINTIDFEN